MECPHCNRNSLGCKKSAWPDDGAFHRLHPGVAVLLRAWGFQMVRQRGSHQQWKHADGRQTTLPVHPGRDISPILMHQIAKDIALDVERFLVGPESAVS
ncbi:MAG: type II toxin-antitoxin system HicA family toxin [Magnetococcales bacterium]|nr:type II toxin-antitoxin system HicA family toxin [Magnetococcales bacterium]